MILTAPASKGGDQYRAAQNKCADRGKDRSTKKPTYQPHNQTKKPEKNPSTEHRFGILKSVVDHKPRGKIQFPNTAIGDTWEN
jgi:hypothetical protein